MEKVATDVVDDVPGALLAGLALPALCIADPLAGDFGQEQVGVVETEGDPLALVSDLLAEFGAAELRRSRAAADDLVAGALDDLLTQSPAGLDAVELLDTALEVPAGLRPL
jgi:hypothetical protein